MAEQARKVAAHHDWLAATYDANYFEHYAIYHRVTRENLRRHLPPQAGSLILDAGGGTGIWALELAAWGYEVVLTDISTGMLAQARAKLTAQGLETRVRLVEADIRAMPELADDSFDMIVCQGDPLSYCGDHIAAIAEFARVARAGASVIASVDNRACVLNWLRQSNDLDAMRCLLETGQALTPDEQEAFRYVIHAFTADELRSAFESQGFEVESVIGKLCLAHRLDGLVASDPKIQEQLVELEQMYHADPAYYPWAGHLEIAARRSRD